MNAVACAQLEFQMLTLLQNITMPGLDLFRSGSQDTISGGSWISPSSFCFWNQYIHAYTAQLTAQLETTWLDTVGIKMYFETVFPIGDNTKLDTIESHTMLCDHTSLRSCPAH